MSEELEIIKITPTLNLKETVKNISKIAPDPDFSYIDILDEHNVVGYSVEDILAEENPGYIFKIDDDIFINKLEELIEDTGVFMTLGFGIDSDEDYYEHGFGAKVTKNEDGEYILYFGTTGFIGHGTGGFEGFEDCGDFENSWDIASKECKEALRIANKTLVLE